MKIRYLPIAIVLVIAASCSSWKHGGSNANREYPRFQHPRIEPVRVDFATAEEANRAPNPFGPAASWFAFDVANSSMVTVLIADTVGTVLDTIVHMQLTKGVYEIQSYFPPRPFSGVLVWMALLNGECSSKREFRVLH